MDQLQNHIIKTFETSALNYSTEEDDGLKKQRHPADLFIWTTE